ncbi:hypothetical protein NDU88_004543 [Pleurodeles waltl]|uniref:Uncharacterized protein n=1 Tax=Pleurodeles waltl TaxID=8319 RepID=A0AAV7LK56_PLEWA|nr:hypothetical protein NDU88_004543 [Pleurodeles waltl]
MQRPPDPQADCPAPAAGLCGPPWAFLPSLVAAVPPIQVFRRPGRLIRTGVLIVHLYSAMTTLAAPLRILSSSGLKPPVVLQPCVSRAPPSASDRVGPAVSAASA